MAMIAGQLHWLNDEIDNLEKTSVISSARSCVKCKTTKLLSVIFGHSSVVIDWCPQCHGIWLDRGEFDSITAFLHNESINAKPGEIRRHEIAEDLKKLWSGGPESRMAELGDTAAAVEGFANATIFEHPALFNQCIGAAKAARSVGLG
jgi:Zn-finger nucleic acid-binding protein